jgi:hypothetical protein
MTGHSWKQKLALVRDVERRRAAVSLSAAAARLTEAEMRIARLKQLSQAVSSGTGLCSGSALASGGECMVRLLGGSIATAVQRERQIKQVETARWEFGIADTGAEIAKRQAAEAEQIAARNDDLRNALKLPFRRTTTCQ